MKEGSKWELYIPSELAYGEQGAGGLIKGGAALIFTMELLKVNGDHVSLQEAERHRRKTVPEMTDRR
jgi:hypothetical protein